MASSRLSSGSMPCHGFSQKYLLQKTHAHSLSMSTSFSPQCREYSVFQCLPNIHWFSLLWTWDFSSILQRITLIPCSRWRSQNQSCFKCNHHRRKLAISNDGWIPAPEAAGLKIPVVGKQHVGALFWVFPQRTCWPLWEAWCWRTQAFGLI